MKELNYPNMIELDEFELFVRPFLTYTEKLAIVEVLEKIDNPLTREYTLDCILLKQICNIEEEMDYDLLKSNGVFMEIRDILAEDIAEIDYALQYYDSSSYNIKRLSKELIELANKTAKNIPSKNKINKILDKMTDKIDEVNNN